MDDIKFELTAEEVAEMKVGRAKTRTAVFAVAAVGALSVLGLKAFQTGADRWEHMELDRQEGTRQALTVGNTTGTSGIACFNNEATGGLEVRDVETDEVYNTYVVQDQDGENCYFTEGPWRASGSVVFNAPILAQ